MEAEDPVMRERLVGLKLQRDQIAKEIGELQNRMASSGRRGDGPRSSRAPRVATHATECQASSRRHGGARQRRLRHWSSGVEDQQLGADGGHLTFDNGAVGAEPDRRWPRPANSAAGKT